MKQHVVTGCVLLALMLNPFSVKGLEASMLGYMLVQIPGLVAGGYYLGKGLLSRFPSRWSRWDPGGIAGLLLSLFTIAYWLLPRHVDAALNDFSTDAWKWVTLPALAGIPLAASWRRLHPIARGLVWTNLISMLGVMSWLYTSAPIRLCNNYLAQQQEQLGQGMLIACLAVAAYRVYLAFAGGPNAKGGQEMSNVRGAI